MDEFDELEKRIGYKFRDRKLLELSMTLSSASEENNQKLECFGDSVLELVVTEKLFSECRDEKEMTVRRKVAVCDESIAEISKKLDLDDILIRGKGDVNNKKAIPSAYEALIAAIYLDGGLDEARKFVLSTVNFDAKTEPAADYKSKLQELLQLHAIPLPVYTHEDVGTPQAPAFIAHAYVCRQTFTGRGPSVKAAEKDAARAALEKLEKDL
ncbi:MAG: putative dsRNA-binding protein [Clostridia bacterium]|nr:putative dsRNA-binding protein [Clostridia bacterium]